MKALVAMSGGVDSSVAAYLLKKQGYDVTGLSFELWDQRDIKTQDACCSVETVSIAREIARKLEIDHQTVDVRDAFYRYVIEDFCNSYLSGMTPNPCILCNKFIKFRFLLEKAEEMGSDIVATGHYARIERPDGIDRTCKGDPGPQRLMRDMGEIQGTANGRVVLRKGADRKKDQSYVLYVMSQRELASTVFPLGELTKEQTRKIALQAGLSSALRPESQEICFVGDGSYTGFVRDFAPDAFVPGPIVDMEGKEVGTHKGIAFYTPGQRKRLGIRTLRPHYVINIERGKNTVIVGTKEDATKRSFTVRDLNWVSIGSLIGPIRAKVKIRSTMVEKPALIIPVEKQRVTVEFDDPQWAPASGQSAVFYQNEAVLGGGVIE